MKKYTYEVYDYSFLKPKDSWSITNYLPTAVKVAAQTIGFDLTEVQPMNEPSGQLYWVDTIYEPVRDGGWEVTFTTQATAAVTTDYSNVDITIDDVTTRINDVSNHISNTSSRGNTNYVITSSSMAEAIAAKKSKSKASRDRNREYFKKANYFRKLNKLRYGKKV